MYEVVCVADVSGSRRRLGRRKLEGVGEVKQESGRRAGNLCLALT